MVIFLKKIQGNETHIVHFSNNVCIYYENGIHLYIEWILMNLAEAHDLMDDSRFCIEVRHFAQTKKTIETSKEEINFHTISHINQIDSIQISVWDA